MKYFNQINDNGNTYSIDNARIEFYLDPNKVDEFQSYLRHAIHSIQQPSSAKPYQYRNLVTMNYNSDSSASIGFSFNDTKDITLKFRGFFDFNPNKVADSPLFWEDFRMIRSCCKTFEVKRVDLAVDIPTKREYMILKKDKRKYRKDMNSLQDCTEYLGKRSHVGFVKLYNKTIESQLDKDLTRLEITIEDNTGSYFEFLPKVYDIGREIQLGLDIASLNDTEQYILKAEILLNINGLDDGLSMFNSLGRKMRAKLAPFICPDSYLFVPSRSAVDSVLALFHEAFNLY